MQFKKIIAALCFSMATPAIAEAAPIQFTYTGVDGSVAVNGGAAANIDLTVVLSGNTSNYVTNLGLGGSGYNNLAATFSSAALGLSNVSVLDTIWLYVAPTAFGAAFQDGVYMQANGAGAINGLFNGGGAFASYNGVSNLGPVFAPNGASGALILALANGMTVSIDNFDGAIPFADSSFSAQIVPLPGAVPLFLAGLAGLGFARRRRTKV